MNLFEDNFFNEYDFIKDLNLIDVINNRGVFYHYNMETNQQHTHIMEFMHKIFKYDENSCVLVNKIKNINDLKNLFQDLYNLPFFPGIYKDRHAYGKRLYELFHKYLIYFKI